MTGSRYIVYAVHIKGLLDEDVLSRCLDHLVERHEALRTRIIDDDGIPRQIVDGADSFRLRVVDLTELAAVTADEEIRRVIDGLEAQRIDLETGPLFDALLGRMNGSKHVLVIGIDHIVTDGYSMSLFFRELWLLYRDLVRGGPPSLSNPVTQYGEFAVWQRERQAQCSEQNERYWKSKLSGAVSFKLPADNGLEHIAPFSVAEVVFSFGSRLSAALETFARESRVSVFMVVLALYSGTLWCWCKQRDFVVQLIVNGRLMPEHYNMMGVCIDFAPLRLTLSGEDTFIDLIGAVSREFYLAQQHTSYGIPEECGHVSSGGWFNWLPEELCVAYEDAAFGGMQLSGCLGMPVPMNFADGNSGLIVEPFPIRRRRLDKQRSQMRMRFLHSARGIFGSGYYRADLFRPDTMRQLMQNLRLAAEYVIRNAESPMHEWLRIFGKEH